MTEEDENEDLTAPDVDAGLVAVIGMAGRFPGAANLDRFWQNLRAGVESVVQLGDEQLLADGESPVLLRDPAYVRACPVLEDLDKFDAGFFGFSPREAAITDPQHRIFFETAWAALENAGYVPERARGVVGVFATCGLNYYLMHHLVTNQDLVENVGEWLLRHTGNDMNFLATRVSYEFDLRGPSLNVQTACSSSLVAVHLAAQSLLNGECDLALAGGSTISLPQRGYVYKEGEILSADGHCRPFDARSTGTLFGSGAGCVILKRLADARSDGDRILAVVRGSAINNDGSQKVGYLAPSVEGQASVVSEALNIAGIEADSVSYVETHGTGTLIGDPIEVAALTQAYRTQTQKSGYCAIGSLKSNIGHLGEAAGIAGLIKTVLSLEHREIPASLNFEVPNPRIDFAKSPFYVNARTQPWKVPGGPRRAGITALGAGGTNAHMILEEGPEPPAPAPSRRWKLLELSARSPAALEAATRNLATHLKEHPGESLADVAYTLQVGRRGFPHRRIAVCKDAAEAIALLEGGDPRKVLTQQLPPGPPREVVFLFPGGGAQYAGMGQDLHETEPVYRAAIDECLAFARTEVNVDLRQLLFPENRAEIEASSAKLERPSLALPVLFATEYAMAKLLLSWGIEPAAMIGHSMGEYVAACLAGVISPRDGIRLVAARGKLFETLPEGGMLVVPLPVDEARKALPDFERTLSIAAVNAPGLCVASGPKDALARLEEVLVAREVDVQKVHINVAAHSMMLEPILKPFEELCRTINFRPPTRPYISNLTGTWIRPAEATDPRYWVQHLRHTVRFADGIGEILSQPNRVCLEVGPGRTLASLCRQQDKKPAGTFTTIAHPKEAASAAGYLLTTLGQLWLAGVEPDWSRYYGSESRRRVALPTYPFERQRHWVDRPKGGALAAGAKRRNQALLKKPDLTDWFWLPSWRRSFLAPPRAELVKPRARLIFADDSGLAERLEALWPEAIIVVEGATYSRKGRRKYSVDPRKLVHFEQLLDELASKGRMPEQILHLGAVSAPRGLPTGSLNDKALRARIDEAVQRHFFGLFHLARALIAKDHAGELLVISSGAERLHDEGSLVDPLKALRKGPARVLQAELPEVRTRQIDVLWPAAGEWEAALVIQQLAAEAEGAADGDVVAYRGSERFLQTFEPARLPPVSADLPPLRPEGTYLITGGFGGVGLTLARHLARTVKANLILLGRTKLPPRDTWDQRLDDPKEGPRLRAVKELESLGARVLVCAADVTRLDDLRGAIKECQKTFGRLHGVIHAAGVLEDDLIALKTREGIEKVLAPKVEGALNLDVLLRGSSAPLDFVAFFSSVSAILGLQGQVDYTAANAFLDALARERALREPGVTVSINWSAWREVGMAAQLAQRGKDGAHPPARNPWLGRVLSDAGSKIVYGHDVSRDDLWLLSEHVVKGGEALIPGTGLLELARAAVEEGSPSSYPVELSDVAFLTPFVVRRGEKRALRVTYDRGTGEVTIATETPAGPELHVTGKGRHIDAPPAGTRSATEVSVRCPRRRDFPDGKLPQQFMDFGPRWSNVRSIQVGLGEALLELELAPEFGGDLEHHKLHPALLDMATGAAQELIPGFDAARDFYVPFSYGRALIRRGLERRIWSHVRYRADSARDLPTFDIVLFTGEGEVLVEIQGFLMKRVQAGATLTSGSAAPAAAATAPGGASAATELREAAFREGMLPAEGVEAFERILSFRPGPQVVASSLDLLEWLEAAAPPPPVERPARKEGTSGAPQGDEVEQAIARMWEDLLGVSPVGLNDDFFELGGHSLNAVRLVARLEKAFKVKLPLGTLFEARTVSQLAALLRGNKEKAPRRISLVPIQTKGSRPPFFCVHGVGGEVLTYAELASLLQPEQPFLGLRAQGHDGSMEPLRTIEEQAALYVKEMREYQPEGPYYIGGYSHGGRVVYEMAQQLASVGQHVAFVGVIDTWPVQEWTRGGLYWLRWLQNLPHWFQQDFRRTGVAGNIDRVRRAWGAFSRKLKLSLGKGRGASVEPDIEDQMNVGGLPESIRKTYQANYEAFVSYRPKPFPGKVTVFRAAAQPLTSPHSPDHCWSQLAQGGVEVVGIPGNHSSILVDPDLQVFARKLKEQLEKAQQEAGSRTRGGTGKPGEAPGGQRPAESPEEKQQTASART